MAHILIFFLCLLVKYIHEPCHPKKTILFYWELCTLKECHFTMNVNINKTKILKLNFLKLTVAHHIPSNTRNYNFLIWNVKQFFAGYVHIRTEKCIILAYLSGYFSYNRWVLHSLKVYYQVTDSCVLLWVFQGNNKCE